MMHPNADLLGTAELNYEQWRNLLPIEDLAQVITQARFGQTHPDIMRLALAKLARKT